MTNECPIWPQGAQRTPDNERPAFGLIWGQGLLFSKMDHSPSSMLFCEWKLESKEGKGGGFGIGTPRSCWVMGRSLGESPPDFHFDCTSDSGGPGEDIPFRHPRFTSRDYLTFPLDPVMKSGMGWQCLTRFPQYQNDGQCWHSLWP